MNIRSVLVAASILMTTLPALAGGLPEGTAATTRAFPNMTLIYVVPGVTEYTIPNVATSFLCTNIDTVTRRIGFVLRGDTGSIYANKAFDLAGRTNFIASTHDTALFTENTYLTSGSVPPVTAYIFATSANIFCTAMIVDAGSSVPNGIALHVVRLNPAAGTEE